MTAENSEKIVTLIGGSGFIGRHIVRALAKRGYRIRVACRRPDLAGHVQPLGTPGQIMPVQANVRYPASLAAVCDGAYAVVNLTGVLASRGAQSFDGIHVFGAEASAKAAKAAKAQVFIQMSALGADAESASEYARTKASGEAKAKAAFPGAIVLRPSIVFGPEDNFFNQFAGLSRLAPPLPLIGGGQTKFTPLFVGDLAEAMDQSKSCACGRGLPRIGTIDGRVQSLVLAKNGKVLPSSFFLHFLKDYDYLVKQYQIVQEERGAIIFKVVKGTRFTADLFEREILQALRQQMGEGTRIDVQFVDLIPLARTGKRQAVISKLSLDFQKLQYPEGREP